MESTKTFTEEIGRLKSALENAEAVIIGAGAGLSASAGFEYGGERFRALFGDFEARYGFHDMYAGAFFPFPTPEEKWAYWSRFVLANRYTDAPRPLHQDLLRLVQGKDHFVITTNVDHCFQKARFEKSRLFYTQGDYGLFQCSVPCHRATYDNENTIRAMAEKQHEMRIPSDLVPRCPKCGKPMAMNLRSDDRFVEDEGWHEACARYEAFVRKHARSRILLLELGVGGNTPGIIKYPFWRLAAQNESATYACINKGEAFCPGEIRERAILIDADIGEALAVLGAMR